MSQNEKYSVRELYYHFKDTTESAIEYGFQFETDRYFLETHPYYNLLAEYRKKLLSVLDMVLENTK